LDKTKGYVQPLQDVFQTELVYPQEKNEVQLTLIPEFQKSGDYDHLQFLFLAEYGLTDRWQVEFEWNVFQKRFFDPEPTVSGTGDIEIGTRYSFMNIGNTNFHTAAGFEVGIPLGDEDKGLGEGTLKYGPFILAAFDLPSLSHAQLFARAGIEFANSSTNDDQDDGEEEGNEMTISGGVFIPLGNLIFTAESTWQSDNLSDGDESQLYLTPGIIFNLPDGWEAGIGVPVGLNEQSDNFRVMALLTFEFNPAGDYD
jgi:hypothetical protein